MMNFWGFREGLSLGLSVGLVVVWIVRLSPGLIISLSGGLGVFLNVGPGVGLSVLQSLGQYMVVISVVVGLEILTWMNFPVRLKHVTTSAKVSKVTKATDMTKSKNFWREILRSGIVINSEYGTLPAIKISGPSGSSTTYDIDSIPDSPSLLFILLPTTYWWVSSPKSSTVLDLYTS